LGHTPGSQKVRHLAAVHHAKGRGARARPSHIGPSHKLVETLAQIGGSRMAGDMVQLRKIRHARSRREPRAAQAVVEPTVVVTHDQAVTLGLHEFAALAQDVAHLTKSAGTGRVKEDALVDATHRGCAGRARADHIDAFEVARKLGLHGIKGTSFADGDLAIPADHQELHASRGCFPPDSARAAA